MLLTEYITSCVDRLKSDAYFADPDNPVSVAGNGDALDYAAEHDGLLAKYGLAVSIDIIECAVVGEPSEFGNDFVRVVLAVHVHEFPSVARYRGAGDTREQKNAHDVAIKAKSLLCQWTPDDGVWHRLRFASWQVTGRDEESGMITRTLLLHAHTFMETVVDVLGNENGEVLVNENNQPFLVSPTDP
jgi:hypothetical protein